MIKKSFELKWLENLDGRCQLDKQAKRRLFRAQLGYQGELEFAQHAKQFLPEDYILLHDLTFKQPGRHLQIDFILVSPHGLHLFEIKNFKAHYQMVSNQLISEQGNSFKNIFYQVEKGVSFLKAGFDFHFPIDGQLVFMSDQDTVNFNGQYEGAYLKRWQLESYFTNLQKLPRYKIDVEKVSQHILRSTVPSHEGIEFEGAHYVDQARTGMICELCKSENFKRTSRYKMKCDNCGNIESFERAVYRTISEYTILHYNRKVKLKDLYHFMDRKVNYDYLAHAYRKYTKENAGGRLLESIDHLKFRYQTNSKN